MEGAGCAGKTRQTHLVAAIAELADSARDFVHAADTLTALLKRADLLDYGHMSPDSQARFR